MSTTTAAAGARRSVDELFDGTVVLCVASFLPLRDTNAFLSVCRHLHSLKSSVLQRLWLLELGEGDAFPPVGLSELTNLRHLHVMECELPPSLTDDFNSSLVSLSFRNTTNDFGFALVPLLRASAATLEVLTLGTSCEACPDGFMDALLACRALRTLRLDHLNWITNEFVLELARLPSLRTLYLHDAFRVDMDTITDLVKLRPELDVYDIPWCSRQVTLAKNEHHDINEELGWHRHVQETCEFWLGPEHQYTQNARLNVASVCYELGMYEEAKDLYQGAYERGVQTAGEEDDQTLISLANVAFVEESAGNYSSALRLYKQCYATRVAKHGEVSKAALQSLACIASVLSSQGEYKTALEYYEKVRDGRRELLGEDDPAYVSSLSSIASVYNRLGDYDRALEQYRAVLKFRELHFGHSHSSTASARASVASVLYQQGMFAESLDVYQGVLQFRREQQGEDHPDTVSALAWVAGLYHQLGKHEQARELCTKVSRSRLRAMIVNTQSARESRLGISHPDTLSSKSWLAFLHKKQCEYETAQRIYEEVLELRIERLGATHPKVASTKTSIADVLFCKAEYKAAGKLYEAVFEFRNRVLGDSHPETVNALSGIASVEYAVARYPRSLELYERVRHLDVTGLGERHPYVFQDDVHVATVRNRLLTLRKQTYGPSEELRRETEAALETLKEALAQCLEKFGPRHPKYFGVLQHVGEVSIELGLFDEAKRIWSECLDFWQQTMGSNHDRAASSHLGLGWTALERGGCEEEADHHLSRALETRIQIFGRDHDRTAFVLMLLGRLRRDMELVREAMDIQMRVFGNSNHYDVAYALELLGEHQRAREIRLELLRDDDYKKTAEDDAESNQSRGHMEDSPPPSSRGAKVED